MTDQYLPFRLDQGGRACLGLKSGPCVRPPRSRVGLQANPSQSHSAFQTFQPACSTKIESMRYVPGSAAKGGVDDKSGQLRVLVRTRYAQDYGREGAERLPETTRSRRAPPRDSSHHHQRAVEQVCPRRISNEE